MLKTTGGAAVEQQEIKTITIKAGDSALFEEHLPLVPHQHSTLG